MAEFTVTITIPDAKVTDMIDAIAFIHRYKDQIEDPQNPGELIANPETKTQFAQRRMKEVLIKKMKQLYDGFHAQQAERINDLL